MAYFSPLSQQFGGWKPPLAANQGGAASGTQAPPAQPPPSNPAAPSTSTFAQMRQQGIARPPAPAYVRAPANGAAPPVSTQPAPSTPPPQPSPYGTASPPVGQPAAPTAAPAVPVPYSPGNVGTPGMYMPGSNAAAAGQAILPLSFKPPPAGTPGQGQPQTPTNPGGAPPGTPPSPPPTGTNPFQPTPAAPPPQYGSTPGATPGQQDTGNALGTSVQNLIGSQLANPNPYNSNNIQTMMGVLNTPIVEQQQQAIQANQANMASRGLFDSTLAEGNLNDINTAAGRQQLSAADTLLNNAAQAQLASTNSAVSNLTGYNQEQFNDSLATNQQNEAQQQQQFQDALQMLGLS